MRLWADILDASGNRLGDGPIATLLNATVSRKLDGAGEVSFSFPATDRRGLALVQNERRVDLFVEHPGGGVRKLAQGIIRKIRTGVSESGQVVNVSGPDIMNELARRSTLLGRVFDNQPIATIASDLIGLAAGWTATVDGGLGNLDARFEGTSVLKAFVRLAEEQGLHLRLGLSDKELEYGAFGSDNGIRVHNTTAVGDELADNDAVLLLSSLTLEQDSSDVINWIIPLGAGEGKAALTLAESDRTSPFTIQSVVGPDGSTLYYLSDAASVTEFGEIQKIVLFKNIAPISNTDNARIRAANALYDAAAAWLLRNSVVQNTYSLTCLKPRQNIRPGDKVRIVYKGEIVDEDGEIVSPAEIDDVFWVLGVTEQVNQNGVTLKLQVSTVDRHVKDETAIVVGALEAIEARNVSINRYPAFYENSYRDSIRSENTTGLGFKDAEFRFRPAAFINEIAVVQMDFKTFVPYTFAPTDSSMTTHFFNLEEHNHYPTDVELHINGVDVSGDFGGPWNTGGTNAQLDIKDLDITQKLIDAPGGIFQEHTIAFHALEPGALIPKALAGHNAISVRNSEGWVQCTFRVIPIVQAIL